MRIKKALTKANEFVKGLRRLWLPGYNEPPRQIAGPVDKTILPADDLKPLLTELVFN